MSYEWNDFKVGDRVRFREWGDMAEEFGFYGGGAINCRRGFIHRMEHLCGTTATISEISERDIDLIDFETDGDTDFFFSTDMIEPVDKSPMYEFDAGEFLSMLS